MVWDIGAGTGYVSVEIARLCPNSKIYALEKTAVVIAFIEKTGSILKLLMLSPFMEKPLVF
ncbi:MAG: hypothetical protein KPI85_05805 [cyanobacterium endosymbiont of Epithemia adnata isolate EadnSB Bon19]